jgi:quinol monooxygenase YgiN
MYGLIGKIRAVRGFRDELMSRIGKDARDMPGCRSFVVAADSDDADAIWITEIWDDHEAHKASLKRPGVREAMEDVKPLIEGFEMLVRTQPAYGA